MKGFLLALQFFTIIPIYKQLPMTKKHITTMFISFPIVGAFMGAIAALVFYLVEMYTNTSSLFTAFFVFLAFAIITGGLHLDGFADMGDAYFSYRSIEKRHEILNDPRIGAFGTISLVVIIIAKILFFNELIANDALEVYWLLFIPFLSRIGMAFYLIQTPASKETGLGVFFKTHIHLKLFAVVMIGCLILATIGITWWSGHLITPISLVLITLVASLFYRYWTIKNFNGSSGDLYGAFIEGMECVLWLTLSLSL